MLWADPCRRCLIKVQQFQRSLSSSLQDTEDDRDQYLGMLLIERPGTHTLTNAGLSLRELIHEFKYQTLVLFKCCLLQPKVHRMYPVTGYPLLTLGRCYSSGLDANDCA